MLTTLKMQIAKEILSCTKGCEELRAGAQAARVVEGVCRLRAEAAIFAEASGVGIGRGDLEDDVVELKAEVVDGFGDEVGVAIAYVLELSRRDAYVEGAFGDVGVSGGFQPGFKALAIDLFLERAKYANPLVQNSRGYWNK